MSRARYLVLIGLAVLTANCDNDSPVDPIQTLSATPAAPVLFIGGSVTLSASMTGALKWASSNTSVATVDSTGLVTGVAPGTTTIRFSLSNEFGETTVQVVAGAGTLRTSYQTTCAVAVSGGALYCWGNNNRGQAGIGNTVTPQTSPAKVNGGLTFTSVTMGTENVCGMTSDGPYCWGRYTAAQVGDGSPAADPYSPNKVKGGEIFTAIEAGGAYMEDFCTDQSCHSQACGLTSSGAVQCWNSTWWYPTPISIGTVATSVPMRTLSLSMDHTCGIGRDEGAYCWGQSLFGSVGISPDSQTAVPRRIAPTLRFQTISAGRGFSCAIDLSGDGYCWGANSSGQLGAASNESCANHRGAPVSCSSNPVKVEGGYKFQSISAGSATEEYSVPPNAHACGITVHREVVCWGNNSSGELGNGSTQNSMVPIKVPTALSFRSVTAGLAHSCALTTDGAVYCWGSNAVGQLGTGNTASSTTPVPVAGNIAFK